MRSAAQKKFLDLGGSAENQGAPPSRRPTAPFTKPARKGHARSPTRPRALAGDLKSVVLHKMSMTAQRSTFPIALGVRITGVDDATYSQTGG